MNSINTRLANVGAKMRLSLNDKAPSSKAKLSTHIRSAIGDSQRKIREKLHASFSKLLHQRASSAPTTDPQTPKRGEPGGPLTSNPPDLSLIHPQFRGSPKRGEPGGPLTSNPPDLSLIHPQFFRNFDLNYIIHRDDSDDESGEVDASDSDRRPRLKRIPKFDQLSIFFPDNVVLQAPKHEDEDEVPSKKPIHRRAMSLDTPGSSSWLAGGNPLAREKFEYQFHRRASTYDYGTKSSLNNTSSPAFASKNVTIGSLDISAIDFSFSTLPSISHLAPTQTTPSSYSESPSVLAQSRLAQSRFRKLKSKLEPKQVSKLAPEEKEKVIVVGVSGPSGSGKSTLVYLLNEIFNPETEEEKISGTRPQRVIHQDDFLKPMTDCPSNTFHVQLEEKEFMERSLDDNSLGLYQIEPLWERVLGEQSGSDENSEDWESCDDEGDEEDEEENLDQERKNERVASWMVTGPDVNCAEAFDFIALEKAVRGLKKRGEVLPDLKVKQGKVKLSIVDDTEENPFGPLIKGVTKGTSEQEAEPKAQHVDNPIYLNKEYQRQISLARRSIQNVLKNTNKKVRFVFVEGTMLYTEPSFSQDVRTRLNSHITIPLFLPEFTNTAKARHFQRNMYSMTRRNGEMWKTEGYFDDVIAKNYAQEYDWLNSKLFAKDVGFKAYRGMTVGGLFVRGIQEYSIAENVGWAVEKVLYETMTSDL